MAESKTYRGGCHCGKVRYEVLTDPTAAIACNCSQCAKHGLWLTFASPDQFNLISGQDALADYLFNKKVIHHLFCSNCGVESFAQGQKPDGSAHVAINVRCLEGVDLAALKTMPFDGRSR